MASIIRIKRSSVSGNPATLAAGELAYSALSDNGSNGGDRLYIGMGTETAGNAVNHIVIGGKYYTGLVDAGGSGGTLNTSAKSVPVLSSTGTIDKWLVGNLQLTTNTLSSTDVNGNISLTPNGTGKTIITNPYIGDASTSLEEYIYDTVGGAVTGGTGITIANNDGTNTSTVSITNTGVTAGSYGSATEIPVLSINAQGQITVASTASVASNLNISGDSGTDAVALLTDTLAFVGGTGITSTVTNNTVTFDIDNTVSTLTGTQTLTNKTIDLTNNTLVATSAQLAAAISDETGTGSLVFATSPSLVTPDIGVATATSVNKVAITAPANGATLFLADGSTLATSGAYSITLISTATTSVTLPTSGTLATLANAETLTNKTISGSTNTLTNIANASLVNSSVTFGSTTVALGATSTSLAGLTELTVDNLNFNGNEISSTNANGDIILSPNGSGKVDVANSIITGVATPVSATDAANRAYVDNLVSGLSYKEAVNLLATTNVALTGSTSTLVIDGHSALDITDDNAYRLLLTGQTSTAENGIYVYTDNGTTYALVRAEDADTFDELIGCSVFVMEGVTYANTGWVQTNHYLTNFDNQTWVQFSGSGAYVAGNGLTLTGTTFDIGAGAGIDVDADSISLAASVAGAGLSYTSGVLNIGGTADRISIGSDTIDIATTYVGQTSITTLGTITTGTWNATTIATTKGGTGLTSYATGDILYASGANTLAKLAAGTTGQVLQMNASGLPEWGHIDGGTY